jgi:hypothetical protein
LTIRNMVLIWKYLGLSLQPGLFSGSFFGLAFCLLLLRLALPGVN